MTRMHKPPHPGTVLAEWLAGLDDMTITAFAGHIEVTRATLAYRERPCGNYARYCHSPGRSVGCQPRDVVRYADRLRPLDGRAETPQTHQADCSSDHGRSGAVLRIGHRRATRIGSAPARLAQWLGQGRRPGSCFSERRRSAAPDLTPSSPRSRHSAAPGTPPSRSASSARTRR